MKKASVGLILPVSSIMPMSRDFENGLKKGLQETVSPDEWEIEIHTEFVGQGSLKSVEQAADRLLRHYQANIVTGIVSNRVVAGVAEKFWSSKTPFLVNNLGEHMPDPTRLNEFIFLNSTHSWQQIWSLGNWAVKQFGKKGMFVSGLYDSGYIFMNMMRLGMISADPDAQLPFSIAPVAPGEKLADPRATFAHIEEFSPDFVFSFFCGEEATIFLEEYRARGFHKTTPLLGLPFLLEQIKEETDYLEIYTAAHSYAEMHKGPLNGQGMRQQNPFPELGLESGKLIGEALKISGGKEIHTVLNDLKITSARGQVGIKPERWGENNRIYLVKNRYCGDKNALDMQLTEELPTISIQDPVIIETMSQPSASWENPYLGV